MIISRFSDQRQEFIEGWIACRNWGLSEPYPDCPYEWGWTLDGVDQYRVWHEGLSAHLTEHSRQNFIDDIPSFKIDTGQLDMFD